jgi:RND family efflux transporter MFP subunit
MRISIMSSPFQERPNSRGVRALVMAAVAAAMAVMAVVTPRPAAAADADAEQTFDCVIDPSETGKLGSPVSGILAKVMVQRGDYVTRDQPVAELQSSVEAATVAYDNLKASSTAAIDAQKERVNLAKAKLDRGSQLLTTKIISEDDFEERRAAAGVTVQDLRREEEAQKLTQLELARDQASLDQRIIRSPLDGIVTEKKLSAGEFVSQDTYIVAVARLDPLHVETYLPVSTFGHVAVGARGTVYPNPPIGGKYSAAVTIVDHVFDPSSGTYGVRLDLPNPDRTLPGGQRCKVGFDLPAEKKPDE